jgi:hypothetical protein
MSMLSASLALLGDERVRAAHHARIVVGTRTGRSPMSKLTEPFTAIRRWWRKHDTIDGRSEPSRAAREARFQAEANRLRRPLDGSN